MITGPPPKFHELRDNLSKRRCGVWARRANDRAPPLKPVVLAQDGVTP